MIIKRTGAFLLCAFVCMTTSAARLNRPMTPTAPGQGTPLQITPLAELGNGSCRQVIFTPDGRTLLAFGEDGINIWDLRYQKPRLVTSLGNDELGFNPRIVHAAALSPDGKTVALACDDCLIRLYRFSDNQLQPVISLKAHDQAVFSVGFSPDGTMMATGGNDLAIFLWDVRGGPGRLPTPEILKVDGVFGVHEVKFTPDSGELIAACGDGNVRTYSITGGHAQPQRRYQLPSNFDLPIAIDPSGRSIFFASQKDVRIFQSDSEVAALEAHTANISAITCSPDGAVFATAGDDGRLVIWSSDGAIRWEGQRPERFGAVTFAPALPPDQQFEVAAANNNGTIYLFGFSDPSRKSTAAAAP